MQKLYCVTVERLGLWGSGAETVLRYCRKADKLNERGQLVIYRGLGNDQLPLNGFRLSVFACQLPLTRLC